MLGRKMRKVSSKCVEKRQLSDTSEVDGLASRLGNGSLNLVS